MELKLTLCESVQRRSFSYQTVFSVHFENLHKVIIAQYEHLCFVWSVYRKLSHVRVRFSLLDRVHKKGLQWKRSKKKTTLPKLNYFDDGWNEIRLNNSFHFSFALMGSGQKNIDCGEQMITRSLIKYTGYVIKIWRVILYSKTKSFYEINNLHI